MIDAKTEEKKSDKAPADPAVKTDSKVERDTEQKLKVESVEPKKEEKPDEKVADKASSLEPKDKVSASQARENRTKEKREARLKRKEERKFEKESIPEFRVGDTIRVYYEVVRGNTKRLQPFEGIVINRKGRQESVSFTVRRIASGGVGVERIWPLYSPLIKKIEIKRQGNVRRAKLFYLRDRVGRSATRVREKRT